MRVTCWVGFVAAGFACLLRKAHHVDELRCQLLQRPWPRFVTPTLKKSNGSVITVSLRYGIRRLSARDAFRFQVSRDFPPYVVYGSIGSAIDCNC